MQFLQKFTCLWMMLLATSAFAQQSIIVVNGGVFGSTNYANTTIEEMGSNNAINMGTINVTSIQDIIIEGQYAYVAAQDSIVKYDWTSKTRVAAAKFGGASTVKLGIHGGHLLVGNWYEPWGWTGPYNNHFRIFNTSDLTFVDSIPAVSKAADAFVVIGDYAYIAQNNPKTVGFGDTLGYLAVVDLTTMTWVRNDTLSTNGDDITRLVAEGDMIYSFNKESNTISSLNTVTMAKNTQAAAATLNVNSYGPTAFHSGTPNVWYVPFNNGIGSYNLSTNTVVNADIVSVSGSFAFAFDSVGNQFCVSHFDYSNQANNRGRIYDMNGDSVGMFQVGFSPEALAIVSSVVGTTTTLAEDHELNYSIFPNPTADMLNVELEESEAVSIVIINQVGQTVLQEQSSDALTALDVRQLPAGAYFVAVVNEKGAMRTQRFVKQ